MLFKVFVNAQYSGMGYILHKVMNDKKLGGKMEKLEDRAAIREALAAWRCRPTETLGSLQRHFTDFWHRA